jgi:hypothetical protein
MAMLPRLMWLMMYVVASLMLVSGAAGCSAGVATSPATRATVDEQLLEEEEEMEPESQPDGGGFVY